MGDWHKRAKVRLINELRLGDHRVRVYPDRLAISRIDDGRLTWEELQRVKAEVWGDKVAIEVYPLDSDVVNLRHTRHLWSTPDLEDSVSLCCVHPEFHNEEQPSD